MKKLFLILALFYSKSLISCTCVGNFNIKEDFDKYNIIISGNIIRQNPLYYVDSFYAVMGDGKRYRYVEKFLYFKYKIKVDRYYKSFNHKHPEYIDLYSLSGNGDCGYQFNQNHSYIIYLEFGSMYNFDDVLIASTCSTTRNYEHAEAARLSSLN